MATTIVFGADSGVGLEIAKEFGHNKQRIILVARDQAKLTKATDDLTMDGITTTNYACDANDFSAIKEMMDDLTKRDRNIENLVFNVGDKHLDDALSSDTDLIEKIFKTNVLSAIFTAKEFLSQTDKKAQRSIIFTGGGAAIHPSQKASTLSLTKAALRSYAYTLHETVKDQNVYVGLVTIQGIIGDSPEMAPEKIAPVYWDLLKKRDDVEALYPEKISKSEFD
ncbi:SDR family NAD(P)-dependent oxidoreductase [Companilactobacillus halodurans]|uniref:SDR family NAD(P)-dependent oxidoreductase n=1 Tax=Companilactobacillus halodurans TaxID=2584183 RepID=A0A5P0ZWF0_9LACO|nr:SDR family NAD(P)-dependent oxidoreductase [Companilactobacillus halodurans]MQS76221.1 SDR family NAD(P)-dependent oxidoreductase [Companilactobacillus halodurans]MQS97361.1 SDR family NAD(P)-dependent oxidoreductase [Companilactobacillus halodurans]